MPGIAGFADISGTFAKGSLKSMLEQINYSDQYVIDSYESNWLAIGRSDLRTFNPEPQPSTRSGVVVFCQGNLVNKDELLTDSVSNADIIADQYQRLGLDFANRLKGHFTTAIWDAKKESLFLANDRFGKHQLFLWSPRADTLFFACEMKCIIPLAKNSLRIDARSITDFLQYNHIMGDKTYFHDIRLLPQASILGFSREGIRICKYWVPKPFPTVAYRSDNDYRNKLHDLMSKAVLRAIQGYRIGVLMSGGLDSRNMTVHLPKSCGNVHTFTHGGSHHEDKRLAQALSEEQGFQFHFVPITSRIIPDFAALSAWILEGNAPIMTSQNMVLLREVERSGVQCVLDGASGALFRLPIPYSLPVFALLSVPIIGGIVLRFMRKAFSYEESFKRIRNHYSSFALDASQVIETLTDECLHQAGRLDSSLREIVHHAWSRNVSIFDVDTSIIITEYVRRMLVNIQNCLGWSVEVVDPILDYDVVDFAMNLPFKYRLWRKLSVDEVEKLHRSSVPLHPFTHATSVDNLLAFAHMIAKRIPLINQLVVKETPRGSGGYPDFLREHCSYFEKVLCGQRSAERGLFKPEKIKALIDEHMGSKREHTLILYRLLCLELWFQAIEDAFGVRIRLTE